MKFRKKPTVIDAVQFDGTPAGAIAVFEEFDIPGGKFVPGYDLRTGVLAIPTLEGDMRADRGDWIIKGEQGEFYPCKPSIFAETYEDESMAATEQGKTRWIAKCTSDSCTWSEICREGQCESDADHRLLKHVSEHHPKGGNGHVLKVEISAQQPAAEGSRPDNAAKLPLCPAHGLYCHCLDKAEECKHCGLRIYWDKATAQQFGWPRWRHHASNLLECFGGLTTSAEPTWATQPTEEDQK